MDYSYLLHFLQAHSSEQQETTFFWPKNQLRGSPSSTESCSRKDEAKALASYIANGWAACTWCSASLYKLHPLSSSNQNSQKWATKTDYTGFPSSLCTGRWHIHVLSTLPVGVWTTALFTAQRKPVPKLIAGALPFYGVYQTLDAEMKRLKSLGLGLVKKQVTVGKGDHSPHVLVDKLTYMYM